MRVFILGASGLLGGALMERFPEAYGPSRFDYELLISLPLNFQADVAFLCAGTKGFQECASNRQIFRADVDGNIRLAKQLLKEGAFVVFVSTDAVETVAETSYARNRLLVEMALVMQANVAIVRPSRFNKENVQVVADYVAKVGLNKLEGVHYCDL